MASANTAASFLFLAPDAGRMAFPGKAELPKATMCTTEVARAGIGDFLVSCRDFLLSVGHEK